MKISETNMNKCKVLCGILHGVYFTQIVHFYRVENRTHTYIVLNFTQSRVTEFVILNSKCVLSFNFCRRRSIRGVLLTVGGTGLV